MEHQNIVDYQRKPRKEYGEKLSSHEELVYATHELLSKITKDHNVNGRVDETLNYCEALGIQPSEISPTLLSRLALTNLLDPMKTLDDRLNTHFEDAFQMAYLIQKSYDVIIDKIGPLPLSREALSYAFLHHDIGKGGVTNSDIYAKLYSIKDENGFIRQTLANVDRQTLPQNLQEILQQPHSINARALTIEEALIGFGLHTKENIEALKEEGFDVKQLILSIYQTHEQKTKLFEEDLAQQSKWTQKEKKLIALVAKGHHLDRFKEQATTLSKEERKLLILVDIIDKLQAFLTRPKTSNNDPFETLYKTQPEKLPQPLQDEYKALVNQLLGARTTHTETIWLVPLLKMLAKRNYVIEKKP